MKQFLVSIGFTNLNQSSDLKLSGAAALSGIGLGQRRAKAHESGQGPEIEWPHLYDVNV